VGLHLVDREPSDLIEVEAFIEMYLNDSMKPFAEEMDWGVKEVAYMLLSQAAFIRDSPWSTQTTIELIQRLKRDTGIKRNNEELDKLLIRLFAKVGDCGQVRSIGLTMLNPSTLLTKNVLEKQIATANNLLSESPDCSFSLVNAFIIGQLQSTNLPPTPMTVYTLNLLQDAYVNARDSDGLDTLSDLIIENFIKQTNILETQTQSVAPERFSVAMVTRGILYKRIQYHHSNGDEKKAIQYAREYVKMFPETEYSALVTRWIVEYDTTAKQK
jgi:hypothetical protein